MSAWDRRILWFIGIVVLVDLVVSFIAGVAQR